MFIINIPKVGNSDNHVKLISIFKKNGDLVSTNDLLFEIETSKAAFDVESESKGFVYCMYDIGDTVEVGSALGFISENELSPTAYKEIKDSLIVPKTSVQTGDRTISIKAQKLIDESNINVEDITETTITEKVVLKYIVSKNKIEQNKDLKFNENDILVFGIGGHAGMCIDIIKSNTTFNLVGFLDDNAIQDDKYQLNYFGTLSNLDSLINAGLKHLVLGVGFINNLKKRDILYKELSQKINIPTIIHQSAIIESSAQIEKGCQIMAGAIIGSNVTIGENCIINSGAIVSHDTTVAIGSHITPGAIVAGHVTVGKRVTIGMGATIYIGLSISDDTVVNNNERILANL